MDILLAIALSVTAADYNQTMQIADSDKYYETNIFLGKNPSKNTVNLYFGAVTASVLLVNETKFRKPILAGFIINQILFIANNHSIGVKIDL